MFRVSLRNPTHRIRVGTREKKKPAFVAVQTIMKTLLDAMMEDVQPKQVIMALKNLANACHILMKSYQHSVELKFKR